jgi:heme/copper-type cytochrome/quinol oxidase subunit 1
MTMGEDNTNRPGLRRWLPLLAPLLAAAAVATGLAIVLAPRQEIGWFAYAPLSNQTFTSDTIVLMDTGARAGYLLIAMGLLTLAFWLGYRVGLRRKAAS